MNYLEMSNSHYFTFGKNNLQNHYSNIGFVTNIGKNKGQYLDDDPKSIF